MTAWKPQIGGAMRGAMRAPSQLTQSALVVLNIVQSDPFFYDPADSTNTSLTGRSGWTRAGDATKGDKIKSADGMFRMNTANNGESPYGFQLTAAPTQNRRISFGYNYSQQVGTLMHIEAAIRERQSK